MKTDSLGIIIAMYLSQNGRISLRTEKFFTEVGEVEIKLTDSCEHQSMVYRSLEIVKSYAYFFQVR